MQDGVPATAEVLPAIAEAVKGQLVVMVDGGIRTGVDVCKALALGADACVLTVGMPLPPLAPMALAAAAKTVGSVPSPVKAAMPAWTQAGTKISWTDKKGGLLHDLPRTTRGRPDMQRPIL